MPEPIYLTKEDGNTEEFVSDKLLHSLVRSGASPATAKKIVDGIVHKLTEGQRAKAKAARAQKFVRNTRLAMALLPKPKTPSALEVYKEAFNELRKMSLSAAARYSLRRSLMEFGPTGFPFEEYVAEIFKAKGYTTLTDQMVLGTCVPHEVDVIAWDAKKLLMAEVKYHNEPSGKTDLKVALYVKARFDDLKETYFEYGALPNPTIDNNVGRKLDEGWLITNTKFTETALIYGKCSGLNMLSWNYPAENNLQDMIEDTKLHPVTCLTTLTSGEKRLLLNKKIVLCKEIYDNSKLLKDNGFSQTKIFKVIEEISSIMNTRPN